MAKVNENNKTDYDYKLSSTLSYFPTQVQNERRNRDM